MEVSIEKIKEFGEVMSCFVGLSILIYVIINFIFDRIFYEQAQERRIEQDNNQVKLKPCYGFPGEFRYIGPVLIVLSTIIPFLAVEIKRSYYDLVGEAGLYFTFAFLSVFIKDEKRGVDQGKNVVTQKNWGPYAASCIGLGIAFGSLLLKILGVK